MQFFKIKKSETGTNFFCKNITHKTLAFVYMIFSTKGTFVCV